MIRNIELQRFFFFVIQVIEILIYRSLFKCLYTSTNMKWNLNFFLIQSTTRIILLLDVTQIYKYKYFYQYSRFRSHDRHTHPVLFSIFFHVLRSIDYPRYICICDYVPCNINITKHFSYQFFFSIDKNFNFESGNCVIIFQKD